MRRSTHRSLIPLSFVIMTMLAAGCGSREWKAAEKANTIAAYERFLQRNPTAQHAALAKERLDNLRWDAALRDSSIAAVEAFCQHHPDSRHLPAAQQKIMELRWTSARQDNSVASYEDFLRRYPDGQYCTAATQALTVATWKVVRQRNTLAEYQTFLTNCDDQVLVDSARSAIRELERVARIVEGTVKSASFTVNSWDLVNGQDVKLTQYPGYTFHVYEPGIRDGMRVRLHLKRPLAAKGKPEKLDISSWEEL